MEFGHMVEVFSIPGDKVAVLNDTRGCYEGIGNMNNGIISKNFSCFYPNSASDGKDKKEIEQLLCFNRFFLIR